MAMNRTNEAKPSYERVAATLARRIRDASAAAMEQGKNRAKEGVTNVPRRSGFPGIDSIRLGRDTRDVWLGGEAGDLRRQL